MLDPSVLAWVVVYSDENQVKQVFIVTDVANNLVFVVIHVKEVVNVSEIGNDNDQILSVLNLQHLDYVNLLLIVEVDVLVAQVQKKLEVDLFCETGEVVNYVNDYVKLVVRVHFYVVSKVVDKILIYVKNEDLLISNETVREAF